MNRKPAARAWIVCLLILALSVCSQAQTASRSSQAGEQLRRKLQEKLDEFHAGGKFPGASVGLALADGTSLGLAVGLSDVESKTAMTPRDLMLQGSVGKTYVAAIAMQLVAEKRLGLDDPIEKYLAGRSGSLVCRTRAR